MFNLGDKVVAGCYLKRNGNFIEKSKDLIFVCNKKGEKRRTYSLVTIIVKDIKKCRQFKGFICGRKKLHTSIYADYIEPEYGNDYYRFYKDDYIDCYEICFEFAGKWCKRLVPVNKVEKGN